MFRRYLVFSTLLLFGGCVVQAPEPVVEEKVEEAVSGSWAESGWASAKIDTIETDRRNISAYPLPADSAELARLREFYSYDAETQRIMMSSAEYEIAADRYFGLIEEAIDNVPWFETRMRELGVSYTDKNGRTYGYKGEEPSATRN